MSILIKGVEMPKDNTVLLRIYPKDKLNELYVEQLGIDGDTLNEYWAVELPQHGRLIDADALYKKFSRLESEAMNSLKTTTTGSVNYWINWSALTERTSYMYDIADAPTIIEAEEDE